MVLLLSLFRPGLFMSHHTILATKSSSDGLYLSNVTWSGEWCSNARFQVLFCTNFATEPRLITIYHSNVTWSEEWYCKTMLNSFSPFYTNLATRPRLTIVIPNLERRMVSTFFPCFSFVPITLPSTWLANPFHRFRGLPEGHP